MAAVRMAPVAAVVAARGGLATLETQAAPFSCRRMALRACLFIVRARMSEESPAAEQGLRSLQPRAS